MKILICGASGLIGSEIVKTLTGEKHQVLPLRRNTREETPFWDIDRQDIDLGNDHDIDVVINLAGENIAEGRWTQEKKEKIRKSRVDGTRLLSAYFAAADHKPKVLISGSAVGYYGDRGDELLDENSPQGSGFLSRVCLEWEEATEAAREAGIRVVNIRLGMVLSPKGGALSKMLPPFRMGIAGCVSHGRQYMSWIAIPDVATAINHIIDNDSLTGPVNLVSPFPVTNRQFTKALGKVLGRPTVIPLPAFMARLLYGEMADALLLASSRALPEKLLKSGYRFQEAQLEPALRSLLEN